MIVKLARKDEIPQEFTSEQMANIKANMPTQTANVNIVPYEIYDYDEVVIGEWRELVDGVKKKKPLYRKVLSSNTAVVNNTNVDLSDLSFDFIQMIGGTTISSNGTYTPIQYGEDANYWFGIYFFKSNQTMNMQGGSSYLSLRANAGYRITIEYTKTTDEWQTVL